MHSSFVRRLLAGFIAVLVCVVALPSIALAEEEKTPPYSAPTMQGWETIPQGLRKEFSNEAGVKAVEFSEWDIVGENEVQLAGNLSIRNANEVIPGTDVIPVTTIIPEGTIVQSTTDAPGRISYLLALPEGTDKIEGGDTCVTYSWKDTSGLGKDWLSKCKLTAIWDNGAYLKDGTSCKVTIIFKNFVLRVNKGQTLTKEKPYAILRSELQAAAFGDDVYGENGDVYKASISCEIEVHVEPNGSTAQPKNMIFSVGDLDVVDRMGKDYGEGRSGNNGYTTSYPKGYEGDYVEGIQMLKGVQGTVYLYNRTYKDVFTSADDKARGGGLYGTAEDGRLINVDTLEANDGTWFAATHLTTGQDQEKAAGFATLVKPGDFRFRWYGSGCSTDIASQAGLSPRLTVQNIEDPFTGAKYPNKITTTDEQFKNTSNLHPSLRAHPTTPENNGAFTYFVPWKSQKNVTAKADEGFRVSAVVLSLGAASDIQADTSWKVNVTEMNPGDTVEKYGYSVTLNQDLSVSVHVADVNTTGVGGSKVFMADHTVQFAAMPYKYDIKVTKVWDCNEEERAHEVPITLTQNGASYKRAILSKDTNNWTITFEDVPRVDANGNPYTYAVTEDLKGYTAKVAGDADTGFTITNTPSNETVTIAGTKTWKDDVGAARPAELTVRLHADGDFVEEKTVDVDSSTGKATWAFDNMPKYKQGDEIIYTVTEDAVANYDTTYNGANVTNKYNEGYTSLTVEKAWRYLDGKLIADTEHMPEVTVQLYANGTLEADKTIVLNEANRWEGVFHQLPIYDSNGNKIDYTVNEVPLPGFKAEVTGDATKGYLITNTEQEYQVSITKMASDTEASLSGADLELEEIIDGVAYDVDEWTSGTEAETVKLLPGTYVPHEAKEPAGYNKADDITFEVIDSDQAITMVDDPVLPEEPEGAEEPMVMEEIDDGDEEESESEPESEPETVTKPTTKKSSTTKKTTTAPTVSKVTRGKLARTADGSVPGGIAGMLALVGLACLAHRRRANS